jgi:hypothetical protein
MHGGRPQLTSRDLAVIVEAAARERQPMATLQERMELSKAWKPTTAPKPQLLVGERQTENQR